MLLIHQLHHLIQILVHLAPEKINELWPLFYIYIWVTALECKHLIDLNCFFMILHYQLGLFVILRLLKNIHA